MNLHNRFFDLRIRWNRWMHNVDKLVAPRPCQCRFCVEAYTRADLEKQP